MIFIWSPAELGPETRSNGPGSTNSDKPGWSDSGPPGPELGRSLSRRMKEFWQANSDLSGMQKCKSSGIAVAGCF